MADAVKVDYVDERGIRRRVLLPKEGLDPAEGIPLSLDIAQLYSHMPPEFLVRLSEALFARGLVEPADFFKPGAHEQTRDAVLDVTRYDALSIISLAKQMIDGS